MDPHKDRRGPEHPAPQELGPSEGVGSDGSTVGGAFRSAADRKPSAFDRLSEADRLLRSGLSDEAVERASGVSLNEIVMLRASRAAGAPAAYRGHGPEIASSGSVRSDPPILDGEGS